MCQLRANTLTNGFEPAFAGYAREQVFSQGRSGRRWQIDIFSERDTITVSRSKDSGSTLSETGAERSTWQERLPGQRLGFERRPFLTDKIRPFGVSVRIAIGVQFFRDQSCLMCRPPWARSLSLKLKNPSCRKDLRTLVRLSACDFAAGWTIRHTYCDLPLLSCLRDRFCLSGN